MLRGLGTIINICNVEITSYSNNRLRLSFNIYQPNARRFDSIKNERFPCIPTQIRWVVVTRNPWNTYKNKLKGDSWINLGEKWWHSPFLRLPDEPVSGINNQSNRISGFMQIWQNNSYTLSLICFIRSRKIDFSNNNYTYQSWYGHLFARVLRNAPFNYWQVLIIIKTIKWPLF